MRRSGLRERALRSDLSVLLCQVRSVTDEPACHNELTKSLHGRSLFPADLFIQPGDQPPIIKEQKIIRRRSAARPWAASGASLACPALQNYPRDLSQRDALPPCPLGLVGIATELRGRGPTLDLELSRVQAADAHGPHPTGKGAGVADIWLVATTPSAETPFTPRNPVVAF